MGRISNNFAPIGIITYNEFFNFVLETDFIAIIFSALLSLGGFLVLISSFGDDDDDQDGRGTGSPVLQPKYAANPA